MKVIVIFDFPGIDPDSEDADNIINILEDELDEFCLDTGNTYYIDDAVEEG